MNHFQFKLDWPLVIKPLFYVTNTSLLTFKSFILISFLFFASCQNNSSEKSPAPQSPTLLENEPIPQLKLSLNQQNYQMKSLLMAWLDQNKIVIKKAESHNSSNHYNFVMTDESLSSLESLDTTQILQNPILSFTSQCALRPLQNDFQYEADQFQYWNLTQNNELLKPQASLSKLALSLFFLYQFHPKDRFKYQIDVIQSDVLQIYINSQGDPLFDEQKLRSLLIYILNKHKINSSKSLEIYLSPSTFINVYKNEKPSFENYDITKISNLSELNSQLQLQNIKDQLNQKINNVKFNITKLEKQNELNETRDHKSSFNLYSSEFQKYLHYINITSHNLMADVFWFLLKQKLKNEKYSNLKYYLEQKHGLSSNDFLIFNGSGLPLKVQNQTLLNQSTCRAQIQIMLQLHEVLQNYQLKMEDLLYLPLMSYEGTLQNDSLLINLNQSQVFKTGRLFSSPTLNIVGFNTQNTFFAFLASDFENQKFFDIEKIRNQFVLSFKTIEPFSNSHESLTLRELDKIFLKN